MGPEGNAGEQVSAKAPSEPGKEENLIISTIKAMISKKGNRDALTRKRLSWKASRLNLL